MGIGVALQNERDASHVSCETQAADSMESLQRSRAEASWTSDRRWSVSGSSRRLAPALLTPCQTAWPPSSRQLSRDHRNPGDPGGSNVLTTLSSWHTVV